MRNKGVHIRFDPDTLDLIERVRDHLRGLTSLEATVADAVRFALRQTVDRLPPKKKQKKGSTGVDTVDPGG